MLLDGHVFVFSFSLSYINRDSRIPLTTMAETVWYEYNLQANHELKAAPTILDVDLEREKKGLLAKALSDLPLEYKWPAPLYDMIMGQGKMTEDEMRSLAEFLWLQVVSPLHMNTWLRARGRLDDDWTFVGIYSRFNDLIPEEKRGAAMKMLRLLVLQDLCDGAYNPWATEHAPADLYHYNHRCQVDWKGDAPITMPETGISFMPFARKMSDNSLPTLLNNRVEYIKRVRDTVVKGLRDTKEKLEATLRTLQNVKYEMQSYINCYREMKTNLSAALIAVDEKLKIFSI